MYKILAKCLVIVVLCSGVSTADIVEPRNFISRDADSFSKSSEWEGVWGEMSLCDPLNKSAGAISKVRYKSMTATK